MKKPYKIDVRELEHISKEGIKEYIEENIRDIINFDSDDNVKTKSPFIVKVEKVVYSFELKRGDCIESTDEHRIFDWSITNLTQVKQ